MHIGLIVSALALLAASTVAHAADKQAAAERREMAKSVRAAAEKGDPRAEQVLGVMYLEGGMGVRKNYGDAAQWLQSASDHGQARATFLLGELYLAGKGEPKDPAQGAKLIGQAAEKGDVVAMGALGEFYEFGDGVPADLAKAVVWYKKAVDKKDPRAEARLGMLTADGKGVAKNPTEGVRLLRDAAEWGDGVGMYGLAQAYARGIGIKADPVQAYIWAMRGAEIKDKGSVKLAKELAGNLSEAQRTSADKLAGDWSPRDPGESDAMAALEGRETAGGGNRGRLASTGSGFYVTQAGLIITNHHVIDGCARLAAGTVNMGISDAKVIGDNVKDDLALIQSSRPAPAVASLRGGEVRQAENVLAYGFPLVGELSTGGNATLGYVTALAGARDDTRFLQISAPLQPGNSGGPIVDDSGNVVGVARAVLTRGEPGVVPQNVNFAIKASVLRAFLNGQKVKYGTAAASAAKQPADLSDQTRGFTVVVACYQ